MLEIHDILQMFHVKHYKEILPIVFINQKLDYLRFSATIAASAIELTFTSNSSERDVKITGAFVPVKNISVNTFSSMN